MTTRASGPFGMKLTPRARSVGVGDPVDGRMGLAKQFQGDLVGTSQGEMLAGMTEVAGSAGSVAMERFFGKILGRKGAFALKRTGTMDQGVPHPSVTVVPNSEPSALVGLVGKMNIHNESGKHTYDLNFTLPAAVRVIAVLQGGVERSEAHQSTYPDGGPHFARHYPTIQRLVTYRQLYLDSPPRP